MQASFEEKSAWMTLGALVIVFGLYFVAALRLLSSGVTEVIPFLPLLTLAVVLLVVILVASHVIVAIGSRPDGRDERDRLISWRAEHGSSWVLGVGTLAAIFGLATPVGPAWIANGLLLALFLSEVANYSLRVFYYRRGI